MAFAISSAPSGATRQTPSSKTSNVSRRTSLLGPQPARRCDGGQPSGFTSDEIVAALPDLRQAASAVGPTVSVVGPCHPSEPQGLRRRQPDARRDHRRGGCAPSERSAVDWSDEGPAGAPRAGKSSHSEPAGASASTTEMQLVGLHRLGQVLVAARGQDPLPIALHRLGRQREIGMSAPPGSARIAPGRLQPGHARHLHVHDDEIGQPRAAVSRSPRARWRR